MGILKNIKWGIALALGVLLVASATPAVARAADVPHDISKSTLTISHDGSYTVTGTTTTNRIVVEENVTATVTLNGVNITGTSASSDSSIRTAATSPIDLAAGATLTLILSDNSINTLIRGMGGVGVGAPGIHVPVNSTLFIQGGDSLSVTGGASTAEQAGTGIGGKAGGYVVEGEYCDPGEDCGTVIILGGTIKIAGGNCNTSFGAVGIGGGDSVNNTAGNGGTVIILSDTATVKGGSGIGGDSATDIGGGNGTQSSDNGQGIKLSADGTYTVYGDLELPCDITIPTGATVAIPKGASLTVPEGITLTNSGTIQKEGGSFINDGTVTGQQPADDRYTINYAEETITIAEGYSVYTTETGDTQIQSGGNITDYIGQSLYIQRAGSETAGRTKISIPARPAAPTVTGASIDYANEKISLASGTDTSNWECSTDGLATWNDVPSGMALSDMGWDGSAAKTYYFRTGATDASFASTAATKHLYAPARPAAPAFNPTVTKTANSITISSLAENQEYRIYPFDSTPGEWEILSATDSSYTWESLQPGTEYTIETRIKAGRDALYHDQFASWPASITVTTDRADSALTAEPSSATLTYGETLTIKVTPSIAASGINTLTTAEGKVELKKGETVLASATEADADGSYTLTYDTKKKGLAIGSNTLAVSYGGSDSLNPSTATVNVTLEKRMISASLTGTATKPYDGTVAAPDGLTLALPGILEGDTVTVTGTIAYDTKDVGTGKTITASNLTLTGADAGYYYLVSGGVSANNGSITAADLGGTLTITGTAQQGRTLTAGYVPANDEQVTFQWNRDGEPISGAAGSTYTLTGEDVGCEITVTATAADPNHTGSVTSDPVTVPAAPSPSVPSRPPTDDGPDWDDVSDGIADAADGDRVVVDMDGETELPGEVIEALAGSDVTLVLEMGDGVAWEIAGTDVPEDIEFDDIDMGVELGGDTIPVDVVDLVTGERGSVQVELSHDGPFGFALTLVAPLGEDRAGMFANLYCYDGGAGALSFEAAGVVDGDGSARVRLDHASSWLIALDTRLHALPFADAGEDEWYSEAVRWAWLSGVMTGYEGTDSFGTKDALTRAQMASVLYRLAGSPGAEASGLPADCDASAWYAGCVAWSLEAGVFAGYGDGSAFGPDDPLTREQAACVLMRAAASAGADPSARADLSAYPDAGGVSEWAADALSWAVAEGVLSGVELPEGTRELQPARACTRAEMAALMMNLSARATE